MNEAAFRFLNRTIRNPWFDAIIPHFSDKDYVIIPGIAAFAAAMYFGKRRTRVILLALAIALGLVDLSSEKLVKNVFQADRPYARYDGVHVHRSGEWFEYDPAWYGTVDTRTSYAFPSTHAANVAAFAAVLAFWRFRSLAVTVPVVLLVGFSRIYTGNHTLLDVLGGYLWGTAGGALTAAAALWLWGRTKNAEAEESVAPTPPERKALLWLLGIWTLLNFGFVHSGMFTLSGDEAQYWTWSRELQWGYYSKPPLTAWLMAALASAGGSKEWALRSGAVLLHSGTLALLYALTLRVSKRDHAALAAVLAAIALPVSWAGSVLLTPDVPLAFFWILAMYAFHEAVDGKRGWWVVTGCALGLGMLTKYTILLLAGSFLLYLLLVDRRWWRSFGPYVSGLVMAAWTLPVFYWNWRSDWVSFRHTAAIGVRDSISVGQSLRHVGEYLGGQGALVTPLLFALLVWATVVCFQRWRSNRDAALLALCSSVVFLFYLAVSVRNRPQPNWPVCAYFGAAAAFGWLWTARPRSVWNRRFVLAALGLGCLVGMAARSSELLYWAGSPAGPDGTRLRVLGMDVNPGDDPTNEMRGARELGEAVSRHAVSTNAFVFSNRYQMTALLAFYMNGQPRTYCINIDGRRYNQYDMWGGWEELIGRDGLFVTGGDETKARAYMESMKQRGVFEDGEYLETVSIYTRGVLIRQFTISHLKRFTGVLPEFAEGRY